MLKIDIKKKGIRKENKAHACNPYSSSFHLPSLSSKKRIKHKKHDNKDGNRGIKKENDSLNI